MRKNFKIMLIGLLALICIASIGAYVLLAPHYKTIEVNGYTMEVPESPSNVTSVNDNYKTYTDQDHNITIKSYAINNLNETNYTGSGEVGYQIGINAGTNTTIENKTVLNKSGTYTYFDISMYQNIVITTDDYDTMSHILKTLNKTEIKPVDGDNPINLMTISNNTTDSNNITTQTTTRKTQSTNKKTMSKSSSGSSYSSSSKPKDTVNGGAKDIGGDYYQTADGKIHYGAKMYDHPGDSRYYHAYYP